jgi:RimJ/RimL family protein N-acetyltransferase
MTGVEFVEFRAWADRRYADEHVEAGTWAQSGALERSQAEMEQLLPKGVETSDHFLRVVEDETLGGVVGEVWYHLQRSEASGQLFVYWIGIREPFRGHGRGTVVLQLLEAEARRLNVNRLALHVFAHNTKAQALYARLGYLPTNVLMAKTLPP